MSTAQQEIKQLRRDIEALQNTLADQLEETVANGKSRTKLAQEEIERAARNAGVQARTFINNNKERAIDARDRTQAEIIKRPLTSAAIAFAGGVLLSRLFSK